MADDEVLIAGNDFTVGITAQEPQTDSNGNFVYVNGQLQLQIIDLTGASIKWILKKHSRDASYFVFKSTSDGGIVIDNPTAGHFNVILAPTDTTGLDGEYYSEAELIDAAGHVSTLKRDGISPGWILRINPNGMSKSGK